MLPILASLALLSQVVIFDGQGSDHGVAVAASIKDLSTYETSLLAAKDGPLPDQPPGVVILSPETKAVVERKTDLPYIFEGVQRFQPACHVLLMNGPLKRSSVVVAANKLREVDEDPPEIKPFDPRHMPDHRPIKLGRKRGDGSRGVVFAATSGEALGEHIVAVGEKRGPRHALDVVHLGYQTKAIMGEDADIPLTLESGEKRTLIGVLVLPVEGPALGRVLAIAARDLPEP